MLTWEGSWPYSLFRRPPWLQACSVKNKTNKHFEIIWPLESTRITGCMMIKISSKGIFDRFWEIVCLNRFWSKNSWQMYKAQQILCQVVRHIQSISWMGAVHKLYRLDDFWPTHLLSFLLSRVYLVNRLFGAIKATPSLPLLPRRHSLWTAPKYKKCLVLPLKFTHQIQIHNNFVHIDASR